MAKYLTDKQLAKKNEGYSPDRAGESINIFCSQARAELIAKLVKPNVADEEAFTAYITEKVAIRNMNYNELRALTRLRTHRMNSTCTGANTRNEY